MRIAATALLATLAPAVSHGAGISVAFPPEGAVLPYSESVYVIGATAPGRPETVYVGNTTADVWRTGAFIAMTPVSPGTNTVSAWCGRDRVRRRFVIAPRTVAEAHEPFQPIASEDDPRLGPPSAWCTISNLFTNRVRAEPDNGDTLHYLPKGFILRGCEVKGTDWIAVWLEGRAGFLPPKVLKRLPPSTPIPPPGLIAPDPTAGFPDRPPYGKPPNAVRVFVDPGHGGSDSGALSPHGWREKDVNLMQARAIRDALEKADFQVLMTRDGDSFPLLMDRPKMAYDERVDAFISVHHNASPAGRDPRQVRHTTTYASNEKGLALAAAIQKHIGEVLAPVPNAGPQIKSLAVCRNPAVPSCLLEVDFINLPVGEEESWNPERQRKVARAVVYGILDWMTPPPPSAGAGRKEEP